MKKKILLALSIILMFVFMLCIVSCVDNGDESSSTSTQPQEATSTKAPTEETSTQPDKIFKK